MKLEYERTLDDYAAFARMHWNRAKKARARRLRVSIMAGVAGGCLSFSQHSSLAGSLFVSVAAMLVVYFGLPAAEAAAVRAAYRKNKANIGPSEIELRADGIVGQRGDYELKIRWSSVGDLVAEGDCTFIYLDENAAFIIPHRRITSGNYVLFMQELARRMEAHTLAPLNAPIASPQTISTAQAAPEAETINARRG